MASSMVIKVKYGDMLRRFNATIDGNNQLDLDMAGLKSKVLTLFSLSPESDINLTYIDEDGDIVALIDDDDLRDAMRQQLKFLRIDAHLNKPQGPRKSTSWSSASSTPLRSPRAPPPPPAVLNVNRVLQSLPEAIQESLTKVSVDLASKAASSSPLVAEIVDALVKVGLSGALPVDLKSSQAAASDSASGSKAEGKKTEDVPVQMFGTSRGIPVDLNKLPVDCESSEPGNLKTGPASVGLDGDNKNYKKLPNPQSKGKSVIGIGSEVGPGSFCAPEKHSNPMPPPPPPVFHPQPNFNECPFLGLPGMGNVDNTRLPLPPFFPFKKNHGEAMGGIVVHRGIRCDGCNIYPITGPRFKSKVKDDYDLCSICFSEMGTEAEYMRIDRPLPHRHHRSFKGSHEQVHWGGPHVLPHAVFGCGSKSSRPKLDSRFVLDVNVMDGTVMPPSAPFTKIWRMRNNGSVIWPRGTQLVLIGGDRFSEATSVEMEIPASGLPLESELDVAVDFIAPEHPGRYISYWRMSTPSGQKFGQRVWVLIQVDASLKNSIISTVTDQYLNLDVSTLEGPKLMEPKAVDSDVPNPVLSEPEKPINESQPEKNVHEENFPINDTLLVGQGASAPPATEVEPPVTYPIIKLSEENENVSFFENVASASPVTPLPAVVPTLSVPLVEAVTVEDSREAALLRELEGMGFMEIDLNKEILRNNQYDLGQSVDQLCGIGEWDPMLDMLAEMGFRETEVNKKLLEKNDGSVKKVVIDLINGVRD